MKKENNFIQYVYPGKEGSWKWNLPLKKPLNLARRRAH